MIRKSEYQFQRSDESAYSIVPSRMSMSTWQTDGRESMRSEEDIVYRRLSFEDDLFTARVYKRNYRHSTILKQPKNITRQPARLGSAEGPSLPPDKESVGCFHSYDVNGKTRMSRYENTAVVPDASGLVLCQADERFLMACESGDHASVQKGLKSIQNALHFHDWYLDGLISRGFHAAIQGGHIEVAETLLQNRASVEDPRPGSRSTLMKDDKSLEDGIRVRLKERRQLRAPPIHTAVMSKQTSMVRFLLSNGANIGSRNPLGEQPVHLAAEGGPIEILRLLIEKGAIVNCLDMSGRPPLHHAAKRPNRSVAIALLVDAGADIEASTTTDERALHLACREDLPENVRALLALGAASASPSPSYIPPLYTAVSHGSTAALEVLLVYGIDPNWNGSTRTTAIHRVIYQAHRLPQAKQSLDLLLRYGIDVNGQDLPKGDTALHFIARYDVLDQNHQMELVATLLRNGADPNICNNMGHTSLFFAMQNKSTTLQSLLVKAGAKLLPVERDDLESKGMECRSDTVFDINASFA